MCTKPVMDSDSRYCSEHSFSGRAKARTLQVAAELTAEAERLGMYNRAEYVLPGGTIEVVGYRGPIGGHELELRGGHKGRILIRVDAETAAACPVGTRFRLVRE